MNDILFTYYQSPIGLIKVSGTPQYITEVVFVDDNNQLLPSAGSFESLDFCKEQLIEYFNGKRKNFDIPVHQEGTVFQQRVWGQLLTIDYGKTMTYLSLAKRLGDANATRAVAASNGKNKLCIIIPCHRVIASNNSLAGYAWGLWRKKWLLEMETRITYGIQTLF